MLSDELRARFEAANALAVGLGITVEEAREDYARAALTLDDRHRNPFGTAHAATVFALAETAFGMAANMGGRQAVAVQVSIAYIRPGVAGRLTAEARLVERAGPLATYAVEVRDDEGRVIAQVQAVGYVRKQELAELLGGE